MSKSLCRNACLPAGRPACLPPSLQQVLPCFSFLTKYSGSWRRNIHHKQRDSLELRFRDSLTQPPFSYLGFRRWARRPAHSFRIRGSLEDLYYLLFSDFNVRRGLGHGESGLRWAARISRTDSRGFGSVALLNRGKVRRNVLPCLPGASQQTSLTFEFEFGFQPPNASFE